jgi:hypothetical protein
MNTYVIRRENAWGSPEELEEVAARSKEVADSDFPTARRFGSTPIASGCQPTRSSTSRTRSSSGLIW